MRVTNQMMNASLLGNLNNLRARNASLTEQISSGDRITRASEDPGAANDVMRTQSRLQLLTQWGSNLGDAKDWVRSSESALGGITGLLNKAKEIAMVGANGPLEDSVRQPLAAQMDALLDDLVAAMNGKQGDAAMFAGFKTDADPFVIDKTTGTVTYNGDTGAMQRDVGPGVTVTANLDGSRFGASTDPAHPLKVVWQLAQDLKLTAGSATAVRGDLDNVSKALSGVINLRSEIGARDQRLEQLDSLHTDMSVQLQDALQQAQGVDMQKALLELSYADTTYRAALQVGARIIPPTLVDFLR
jgi:flagellar hook-associated protein 3 FlgL